MTTARASWNFSRKRTSSMQVSSGRPHMLTSNQRGRGKEPVVVLGRIRSLVAVNMVSPNRHFMLIRFVGDFVVSGGGYFYVRKRGFYSQSVWCFFAGRYCHDTRGA